ncbi:MAG TPA: hypothetical protein VKR21_05120 [Solirubrobacteraceae bacterium]|nr:hypothetical protein [Solirubrobacteraceae bacterium]
MLLIDERSATRPTRLGITARTLGPVGLAVTVYLASRVLLLAIAVVAGRVEHISLIAELGRWDGTWYGQIASLGYPRHIPQGPNPLGFFPLYPLTMWLVVHLPGPPNSVIIAGVLISCVGGLVATLLVGRLARGWWGEAAAKRAVILFCLFPGSIVFLMAYGEGLLIPLAAGCLLALQARRWVLAGILAGVATAVQPDAVALIVACAVAAFLELRRDRTAVRSLLAPILSVAGLGTFAVFLWIWTGTPLATLHAQENGWGEGIDPLALVHQGRVLAWEIEHLNLHHVNMNVGPVAAVVGAVILLAGVVLLLRRPGRVPAPALAYTLAIGVLSFLSVNVPPNARILFTAFPAVLVFARYSGRRSWPWLIGVTCVLLVVMSALTYGGRSLTP